MVSSLLTSQKMKELVRKVLLWLDKLAEYDFELQYLVSPDNVMTNVLPRADYTITAKTQQLQIVPSSWNEDYRKNPLTIAVLIYVKVTESRSVPAS